MRNSLRLAAVGIALATAVAAAVARAGGPAVSDDAALVLPDQPAGDAELQKQAGTPPQTTSLDKNALPQTPTLSPMAASPELPTGTVTTLNSLSTTSISTLSATVSGNDFHN